MSYRGVLAIRGMRSLTVVAFVARVPATASGIVTTLHVVLTLHLGYGAAGAVAAVYTVGLAVGAPLWGRLVDRRGLRAMLAVTLVATGAYWAVAPLLGLPALLGAAFVGGLLATPVFSVIRQSVAAMVPETQRRTAFAVDSMSVEISYIVGPAVGTGLALWLSTTIAMWVVGAGWVLTGLVLAALDPPTRGATDEGPPGALAGPRTWFTRRLGGALLGTAAAVFVVVGTELVIIASLQRGGEAAAIPLVTGIWAVASLAGGYVYGLLRRPVPFALLIAVLGLATLPVALGGPWWSLALLLGPAGLLCAPSLAASADTVSGLTPEHARGLVTGLHGSAITVGAALTNPITGVLIDRASPAVAVVAVGAAGIVAAGVTGVLLRPLRAAAVAGRAP